MNICYIAFYISKLSKNCIMKKIIIIVFFCIIGIKINAQWIAQSAPSGWNSIWEIYGVGENIVYVNGSSNWMRKIGTQSFQAVTDPTGTSSK